MNILKCIHAACLKCKYWLLLAVQLESIIWKEELNNQHDKIIYHDTIHQKSINDNIELSSNSIFCILIVLMLNIEMCAHFVCLFKNGYKANKLENKQSGNVHENHKNNLASENIICQNIWPNIVLVLKKKKKTGARNG